MEIGKLVRPNAFIFLAFRLLDSCCGTPSHSENLSDVRELTPEFFFLPDFLSNPNMIAFGERQENGETVDNVELPPWAKGNARLFIEKQREALESEYVSCHLGGWIDLVFGSKQRGQAAVEATNVFHHLSYDGAIGKTRPPSI